MSGHLGSVNRSKRLMRHISVHSRSYTKRENIDPALFAMVF